MSATAANVPEPSAHILMKQLGELIAASSHALFGDYDVSLETLPPDESPEHGAIAILGFNSDRLRGAIGLAMDHAALIHSTLQVGLFEEDCYDWLGELSNQLLGRLKSRLFQFEVNLHMASPVVLRGLRFQFGDQESETFLRQSYRCGGGAMSVWLDITAQPGLILVPVNNPDPADATDGALVYPKTG
ncbi:MAG: chemotaxis protein CheX [Myxococcota bacterium]